MDLVTLKSQIKSGELDSLYIFTGEEGYVLNSYIGAIARFTKSEIVRLDTAQELIKRLGVKSMLKSRHIYVLRDCKDFLSSDELQAKFERFRASETIVILVYDSIDKRSKLYKKFQDRIIQFDYLPEGILVKYIQKEIPLSDRNARGLVQICDRDYGRILLEIDKIKQYVNYLGPAPMFDGVFQKLLESGVIYQSPQDRIFDFVDAVMNNKPKLAFEIYNECIEFGENVFSMLVNLYNSAKQVFQYQSYRGNDIEKATGLSSAQIYHIKNRAGKYSNEDLLYLMKEIQHIDSSIKSGIIEDSTAIPYVLTMLWS